MTQGKLTGTDASALALAADSYRGQIVIQSTNGTDIAIGIGEDAVANEGINLRVIGDVVTLRGAAARAEIYIIGNGGTASYVTCPRDAVEFRPA